MFGRNLESMIKTTEEPRSFEDDFFDFTDRLYPWTTVYRFFFLTDLVKKTQCMLGIGQKRSMNYRVNGKNTEFSNKGPLYRVGVSYWLEDGDLIHKTINDVINVQNGIFSENFSFQKVDGDYTMSIPDLSMSVVLDDSLSTTDYVRFGAGVSPFYRHNKYLPFSGEIMGERVSKGFAFIQKVNLNMPFIPWRWGRVFFESGAQLDFYEPRIWFPLFRSINFELGAERIEFKLDQRISLSDSRWIVSGKAQTGEVLEMTIDSYQNIKQTFETKRSFFVYNEMPSRLKSFVIKKDNEVAYSLESLGESVCNCEDAYYTKVFSFSM